MDAELGRHAILRDVSINNVGAHTNSAGWHIDSPISFVPEPLPNFALAVQAVWMLDDFTSDYAATHVVGGSHLTLKRPPKGRPPWRLK